MGKSSKIKGSIVLVPFPFDDFSTTKVRPVLCISDEIGEYSHVIVAFISSKIPAKILKSDFVIKKSNRNGLKVDSLLRPHRIVTIPKSFIRKRLGRVDAAEFKLISKNLIEIIK